VSRRPNGAQNGAQTGPKRRSNCRLVISNFGRSRALSRRPGRPEARGWKLDTQLDGAAALAPVCSRACALVYLCGGHFACQRKIVLSFGALQRRPSYASGAQAAPPCGRKNLRRTEPTPKCAAKQAAWRPNCAFLLKSNTLETRKSHLLVWFYCKNASAKSPISEFSATRWRSERRRQSAQAKLGGPLPRPLESAQKVPLAPPSGCEFHQQVGTSRVLSLSLSQVSSNRNKPEDLCLPEEKQEKEEKRRETNNK